MPQATFEGCCKIGQTFYLLRKKSFTSASPLKKTMRLRPHVEAIFRGRHNKGTKIDVVISDVSPERLNQTRAKIFKIELCFKKNRFIKMAYPL